MTMLAQDRVTISWCMSVFSKCWVFVQIPFKLHQITKSFPMKRQGYRIKMLVFKHDLKHWLIIKIFPDSE